MNINSANEIKREQKTQAARELRLHADGHGCLVFFVEAPGSLLKKFPSAKLRLAPAYHGLRSVPCFTIFDFGNRTRTKASPKPRCSSCLISDYLLVENFPLKGS
jgi:hypothetical protein